MPKVSVVIPHYQDLAALDRCLRSLESQTYPRDDFEVVVADNASPVGEAAVTDVAGPRARVISCAERGAGPARNAGVAASTGEILAFINSDCVPAPAWIENGIETLRGFDFVGGRVEVFVGDPDQMTPTEAFEVVFAFDFEKYIKKKGFTGSGNMFCSRTVFDRVGGFRKGVSEDVDWSHRAREAGFRLGYAPGAVVGHPARHSWQELRAKWVRVNAETFGLYRSKGGGILMWLLRSAALPLSAIVHTPKVLAEPRLAKATDKLAALMILYRVRLWRLVNGVGILFSKTTGS